MRLLNKQSVYNLKLLDPKGETKMCVGQSHGLPTASFPALAPRTEIIKGWMTVTSNSLLNKHSP